MEMNGIFAEAIQNRMKTNTCKPFDFLREIFDIFPGMSWHKVTWTILRCVPLVFGAAVSVAGAEFSIIIENSERVIMLRRPQRTITTIVGDKLITHVPSSWNDRRKSRDGRDFPPATTTLNPGLSELALSVLCRTENPVGPVWKTSREKKKNISRAVYFVSDNVPRAVADIINMERSAAYSASIRSGFDEPEATKQTPE